ncbi:MAG: sulfite exporter TauE/SafE family protein [Actinomycetota bacterium]
MSAVDAIILVLGGFFAGIVNAMAGGGSLLTVPLLSLAGVEGLLANGTNRVGVLIQSSTASIGFARRGVGGRTETLRILFPFMVGGAIGAVGVSQVDDQLFERAFGLLMIPLLGLTLWKPRADRETRPWPPWLSFLVFTGVGFYAGAIQAGVGIVLVLVLSRAGHDLVTANAIKVYVVVAISLFAVAVFISQDQVRWLPALVLSAGTAVGGYAGSQLAVDGGERIIKPVLVVAVLALAGRMIGFY